MDQAQELIGRYKRLKARLDEASGVYGGVEICAVTKTVSPERVNCLYDAGVRILGENKVQEALGKLDALDKRFGIHIIGRLQTNKVRFVCQFAQMVESVDRIELARALNERMLKLGGRLDVLVQANIAREASKAGVLEEDLHAFYGECVRLEGLNVRGLMAVMPLAPDPEELRPYFRRMRVWFERLRDEAVRGVIPDTLSMGMSGDCVAAAREGATLVRVGSALFGARG